MKVAVCPGGSGLNNVIEDLLSYIESNTKYRAMIDFLIINPCSFGFVNSVLAGIKNNSKLYASLDKVQLVKEVDQMMSSASDEAKVTLFKDILDNRRPYLTHEVIGKVESLIDTAKKPLSNLV